MPDLQFADVPERAEVTIDRHILPGETVEAAAAQIRSIVDSIVTNADNAEVGDWSSVAQTPKRRCTYELTWDNRPTPAPAAFVTDPESEFVQTAQRSLAKALGGQPVSFALGALLKCLGQFLTHCSPLISQVILGYLPHSCRTKSNCVRAARSVADTNHLAAHGGSLVDTRDMSAVAAGRPALPTIILGPTGGNTCAANEWVDVESLLPCATAILETTLTMLAPTPPSFATTIPKL